jgi:hypothetical protein
MRLSAQRIEVTPTGLAALHRTLPVVGPHGPVTTLEEDFGRSIARSFDTARSPIRIFRQTKPFEKPF